MPASDHLAPVWVRSLRKQGLDPDGAKWLIELWLEDKPPVPESATRAMRMRLDGVAVRDVQIALGLGHHGAVQRRSEAALTRALAPHLPVVSAWAVSLGAGTSVDEVAARHAVEPWLVEAALRGWPPVVRVSAEQQDHATTLWRKGASLDEIAGALGWPPRRVRQHVRDGDLVLEPTRITPADLEGRLGWSEAQIRVARKSGQVPPPDSKGRAIWWWESTIVERLEPLLTEVCGTCGARFRTARGRAIHASRHRS